MGYKNNTIRTLRTIKALRGEALKIDLGKELQGTLESWMKRSPNDSEYRSFDVLNNRYLYLPTSKASDYEEDGEVVSEIEGKWYFDIEQDLNDGSDKKTIYQGTIFFTNDITGSSGSEGVTPDPGSTPTNQVRLVSSVLESISGDPTTQQETNTEFATEIKLLKQATGTSKPYKFDAEVGGLPDTGYFTLDAEEFVDSTLMKSNQIDSDGLDNSYLFEGLKTGSSIVLRGVASGANAVFTINGVIVEEDGVYSIPIAHDNSIGTILIDEEPTEIEGFSTGSAAVLERDITVAGIQDNTIGVNNGETLEAGTSITDSIEKILSKRVPPTYYQPTASLSVSPSSTQEIADTVNYTLTPSFSQNDAGDISEVIFKRSGVEIHSQSDLSSFTDSSRPVTAGSTSYSVEINYEQGEVKDDNLGTPDDSGRIEAGTVSGVRNVSGQYRNWYGPNGSSLPADGAEIRGLSYSYSNSFILNTGDTSLVHVIAVPSTNSLSSVIDLDALSADLTSSYILSDTLTSVPDAGGNLISYKVYILTVAQAYSSNHRHSITIE